MHILGPTTIPIVSYDIPGMNATVPMPEWRIKLTTPWHELWRGLNGIMKDACEGLMSNETAMQQMKVLHTSKPRAKLLPPLSVTSARGGIYSLHVPYIL